jgi:chlorophyllide a reductase subunit X
MVVNKDDGTGEAHRFAEAVGIPVLSAIPAHEEIRRKSANYQIIGRPGTEWAPLFEELATGVAEAPPVLPLALEQDGLLGLFAPDEVGGNVELEPASLEDMCGGTLVERESLEVVYDDV